MIQGAPFRPSTPLQRGIREGKKGPLQPHSLITGKATFEIHSKSFIGKGGFAKVTEAKKVGDSRTYAVKKISDISTRKLPFIETEIEMHKRVSPHPYIASIEEGLLAEAAKGKEKVYIFMEKVEKGELTTYIDDKIPAAEAQLNQLGIAHEQVIKSTIVKIFDAIKYCHQKNVVHRDLKPDNILMDLDGSPKVADFGFSCDKQDIKRMKEVKGTPTYMAPETILSSPQPTEKVDIYALGCMLHEFLTGFAPSERIDGEIGCTSDPNLVDYKSDPMDSIRQTVNYIKIRKHEPADKKSWENLVYHMVDPNPATRYSIQEVLNHAWCKLDLLDYAQYQQAWDIIFSI